MSPVGAAYRALARAGWRRAAHAAAGLPLAQRVRAVALVAMAALLLAYHAGQSYYGVDPLDAQATLVTQLSRIAAGVLVLGALALAQIAPLLYARAGDDAFLRAAPLPPRALAAWRADQLAAAGLPLWAVGLGMLLPPLALGEPGAALAAVGALAAWLWAVSQALGLELTWSPEGRWGPGGAGGLAGRAAPLLLAPASGLAYFGARELTATVVDVRRAPSLLVTAAMGLALGYALRRAALAVADGSAPAQARLAEHFAVLEWKRRRGGGRRPRPRGTRAWAGGAAWSGAAAWAVKDLRVAARQRGLRTQWALVLLAKGGTLAWVLAARGDTPWVLAGLLLVFSDALAGEALLQHWYHEQPAWVWAAPAPRRAQWAARALPAAALSLAASLTLAATAWAQAGPQVAQPLALWTVAAGLSLVLAAANLGAAAPPRSPLGQNLYGLGLTTALLIGAVFPVVGWAVLAVFALYTFRFLRRDSRP